MLKVDLCVYDSPTAVGGPYVWVQRMPLEWRKRGIDVRIKLFHWSDLEAGVLFQFLRRSGFQLEACLFTESKSNVRWLLESVSRNPPDLFIADNVIPGLLSGRYLRNAGIPTIGILRSDEPFYYGIIDRFVAGKKQDRLSAVVGVSQLLSDLVTEKGRGEVISRTIPSGTPIPDRRAAAPEQILKLVYVGRLDVEQKRIIDTVKALIRVVTEVPNVTVTLFGDGSDRSEVERLIRPHSANILLAGNVRSAELTERLLESHVIVLLSEYEGTPTAVMEAMACGVVPVCSRIRSGVPELVLDQETGLLVGDRDNEFVTAITRIRTESGLWEKLSNGARSRAEAHFSTEICASRWTELIEGLTSRNGGVKRIVVPRRLMIARPHHGYAHQDRRSPSVAARVNTIAISIYRKARIFLGRLRRKLSRA